MLRDKKHRACFYLEFVLLVMDLDGVQSRATFFVTKLESLQVATGDNIK